MIFKRACSVLAAAFAAFVLSGCFVVATNKPAGTGPIADDRLIGAWQGIDADNNEPDDVYLHFQKPEDNGPLRLVWVEDRNYQVYEVTTTKIGNKNVFISKITFPTDKVEEGMPLGYYLGFYTVSADGMQIDFRLLDSEKVGALIDKGKVKGEKPKRKYDIALLTGSPTELARFLASPEADAAVIDDPARVRRILPPKKK